MVGSWCESCKEEGEERPTIPTPFYLMIRFLCNEDLFGRGEAAGKSLIAKKVGA